MFYDKIILNGPLPESGKDFDRKDTLKGINLQWDYTNQGQNQL